jgi:dTDP-4-dehydrorhamnose 3,5-epimerase
MIFTETKLAGAFLVDLERREDERGYFARAWCSDEFAERGLSADVVQCNISYNERRATLRGMHFQAAPHAEAKVIRCTRGAIYDVIVDLRPDSATHARWVGVELSAENGRALYVPEGFAHGYQTLVDATETYYHVSERYTPSAEGGVRWDDAAFGIEWPHPEPSVISPKDAAWPDYRP